MHNVSVEEEEDGKMVRTHRGSGLWRVTRKLITLVVLVIGLRVIYNSAIEGHSTSDTVSQEKGKSFSADTAFDKLKKPFGKIDQGRGSSNLNFKHADELWEKTKSVSNFAQNIPDENYDSDTPDIDEDQMNETHDIIQDHVTGNVKNEKSQEETADFDISHSRNVKKVNNVSHSVNSAKGNENLNNKPGAEVPVPGLKKKSATTHEIQKVIIDRIIKVVPLEEARSYGVCKKVIPWGQTYHAQISTYDLFKRANHTTDEKGEYPIPIKSEQEVTNKENMEPVTVILVPFSHADPGYGMTIEEYYHRKTQGTLNNMVTKLTQYPDMTFQWAETVFLARWFEDLTEENKQQVKRLIKRGQLEIVLGGWVMPDEASTHYASVVDQLIEGHQWLIENLEVTPKNAWINDPFGYSSTMPYLWKSSGMDNLVFLRIDQAVKAQMMNMKSLEFNWRPYWKYTNSSDMLASLMAYTNYWLADVCGPDQAICNDFVFIRPVGNKKNTTITVENLEVKARALYEQYRRTTDLYKYNTLYMGLGEDFSFSEASEWDALYLNFKKLIDYINSKDEWKMKIKFGTLTDYFKNIRKEERRMTESAELSERQAASFPTLSGDFYPYTERKNEYWTGYFTTRPLNKEFSRELEPLVRAADIFNVMVFSFFKYYRVKYNGYQEIAQNLRAARRELGMFLHHDGITGTSLPHVVRDFEKRLLKAHDSVHTAFKGVLVTLLTRGRNHQPKLLQEETVKPGPRQMSQKIIFDTKHENKIVLINSLSKKRKDMVSIRVDSRNFEIKSPANSKVPFQITIPNMTRNSGWFLATFPVELPAFGIEVYKINPVSELSPDKIVKESAPGTESTDKYSNVITIKNNFIKADFDKNTGMLKRIVDRDGRITNISAEFLVYQSAQSGAYIFGPAGPANAFFTGERVVTVTRGNLMSEVKVTYPGFYHSVKLYNTAAIQGTGLHIRNEIDMAAVGMKNMEVILRLVTDVKNGQHFFTDQNGFQLMGRETKTGSKIESNYYPITTMALLEDKHKRLTLHSKQPHGAASLNEGQLEVMLDRHTFRDDGRGLGQGIYDNVKVNSDFVLHIEYKTVPMEIEEYRYTYLTQDGILINELLQNKIQIYSVRDNSVRIVDKVHPLKTTQVPCDISVVGLRNMVKNNLEYNGTSLVLHRKSVQCGYQSMNKQCLDDTSKLTIRSLLPKLRLDISETSLSHLHVIQKLGLDSDIRPEHMELRAFMMRI